MSERFDDGPVVEHSAEGTVVRGTSRDDREVLEALKGHGFRWSRRLEGWYLPRSWREETRAARVRALSQALGDRLRVERSEAPRRTAAEREADQRARAAARAERMDERAARAEAAADAAEARARQISDGIPLGQPILVGHHSQRRHERDLERIVSNTERSVAESRRAREATEAADRARRVAAGEDESTVTIGNRIERIEAELRRVERCLSGIGSAIHRQDATATGEYRARLERQRDSLADQLEHDRAKLGAAGGVRYSRENVAVGDFVRIGGAWYPVLRVNAKTVTVPNAVVPADSKTTNRGPWREVADHRPGSEATATTVRELAAATSAGLAGLRVRLERIAADLETDGRV